MRFPLTLRSILERAEGLFGDVEVVSLRGDGSLHRTTWRAVGARARALAESLVAAGLRRGERVATLQWNHVDHVAAYFGVPLAGGVLHPLNLRLHADELAYVAGHAQDRFLLADASLGAVLAPLRERVRFERVFLSEAGTSGAAAGDLPPGAESLDDFLATARGAFTPPDLDENEAASMCYTSGTTGRSKGVVYSHRAIVLHSFAISLADGPGFSHLDSGLCVAPLFHVNGWGFPYAAAMMGTKLVLPGSRLDATSLLDLLAGERVTLSSGVPTIWLAIAEALEREPGRWKLAPGLRGIVGGSAAPEALIRRLDRLGIRLLHLWGMTETTPLGTLCNLRARHRDASEDERYAARAKQGFPAPFVETRAVDDAGAEVPRDGKALGELQVRGPWVASGYHGGEGADRWTDDGWFRTGDVAALGADGIVRIADRTKDLVKSGGEWISSVDLEGALMGHAAVQEAAVVAVPHPKWGERPLAVVVLRGGAKATPEVLRAHLETRFAKWQVPDAFVFVPEIPKTSVGKFRKAALREQFREWRW